MGRHRARQRARVLRHRLVLRPPPVQRARALGLDRLGRRRPFVDDRRDAGRDGRRRRHLGLGRRRHHVRRPRLGRQRERQHLQRRRRGDRSRRVGRRAQLLARAAHGEPRHGHAPARRLRLRLDADRVQRGHLRLARRGRGQGRRALPLAAREARRRPGAAAPAGVSRDALRLARLGSQDPAALPHDDAGLRRSADQGSTRSP